MSAPTGRELARRHESSLPGRQTAVSGEVTVTRDELAIQLRPTREPRTVITRPLPQPLVVPPAVYPQASRWVFDREAIGALIAFVLITALFLTVWLVVP